MPLNELDSTRALITLEEARLYVLRSAADRSRDEILIDAVNEVSAAIWEYCEREFLPTATGQARVFAYDGTGLLDLRPYDLLSLDTITMYTDLDVTLHDVLTADEYRLEPRAGSVAGTFLRVRLPAPTVPEAAPGFRWQVTVTGDWGMATVPGSVKLACKQWVDNLTKNPGSWANHQMNGYTVVPELDLDARRAGMPPAVRHRLNRWRRSGSSAVKAVRLGRSYGDAAELPTV